MMIKTYVDIHAYLSSWLNADPANTMSVSEIATEIAKSHRRNGHAGPGDTVMVTLAEHIERLAPLESALVTIRSSIPGYLKGEMSEHDFALLVLEHADSSKVNKALEKGR